LRSTVSEETPHGERAEGHPAGDDCRCLCGNLLARVVGDRVELKCRRCKRTLLIPLAAGRQTSPAGRRPSPARPKLAPLRKANAP
jgi:hypothetical protein